MFIEVHLKARWFDRQILQDRQNGTNRAVRMHASSKNEMEFFHCQWQNRRIIRFWQTRCRPIQIRRPNRRTPKSPRDFGGYLVYLNKKSAETFIVY